KIDLEIEGKEEGSNTGVQIMPAVWQGKLYLFWTTFSKKSDTPDPPKLEIGMQTNYPPGFWEIQLYWSVYENGKWARKQFSGATAEYPAATFSSFISRL